MGQGKKKCDPPAHKDHMSHFGEAMEQALDNTNPSDRAQNVTFEVVISPNPGGVKEYIVNIGG